MICKFVLCKTKSELWIDLTWMLYPLYSARRIELVHVQVSTATRVM